MNGSEEISLTVCRDAAQIGIMQIDAIYARSNEGCDLKAIGSYGDEVAMFLAPPRAKTSDLDDLSASNVIGVDTIGSGSAADLVIDLAITGGLYAMMRSRMIS